MTSIFSCQGRLQNTAALDDGNCFGQFQASCRVRVQHIGPIRNTYNPDASAGFTCQTNLLRHHTDNKRIGILRNNRGGEDSIKLFFSIKDINAYVRPIRMPPAIEISLSLRTLASIPWQVDDDRRILFSFLHKAGVRCKPYDFLAMQTISLNDKSILLANKRLLANLLKDTVKFQHPRFWVCKQDLFFSKHGYKYSNRRELEHMKQIKKVGQNKKDAANRASSHLFSSLVREIDAIWNQIEASILTMYEKLRKIEDEFP